MRKANTDQIYMEGMNLGTKIHIWDQIQGEVHLQVKKLPLYTLYGRAAIEYSVHDAMSKYLFTLLG